MSVRAYVCNKYDVEYGDSICKSDDVEDLLREIKNLRDIGYHHHDIQCDLNIAKDNNWFEIEIDGFLKLLDMSKKIRGHSLYKIKNI